MAITIPLRALLPYALGALEYLLRPLLAPAPVTQPISPPYTPPFTDGQCSGVGYRVQYQWSQVSDVDGTIFFNNSSAEAQLTGAIVSVLPANKKNGDSVNGVKIKHTDGSATQITGHGFQGTSTSTTISNVIVTRMTGIGTCGDTPNPNPSTVPPSTNGLGDSGSPNLENNPIVQAGIPVLAIPSFMSALLAALNAAKSASDALAAVRAIAEAIEAIADLLNALKDKADKDKKKDDPNNKEITRNDFGSIRFDGYLRLYPSTGVNEREAIYIDLQLLSIPIWYGKYFGKNSPNFYRFKSLGYISFTSPTFGIIETKEIEFSRMSLNVPSNASGFFYHLGLEGDIVGNISAFYQKPK